VWICTMREVSRREQAGCHGVREPRLAPVRMLFPGKRRKLSRKGRVSHSMLGCTPGFFCPIRLHTPDLRIRWRGIPQLRVVGPDRVRSAGDLGRLARWLAAPVGNYWRTVAHGRPSHRPMVPACDRTLRRAFAPGPPPPPHTAAKTSREPGDQHRLRCTEKMRRPARTINRLGRFWSTRVRARAKAVFWKSRTVRRNIWRRFFSPVWLGSSVSHLGSQSIHAPHSCEQQTHHRHLDQCFAGLHPPLIVFAHASLRESPLNVRSTTHLLGPTLNPRVPGVRSTTSR
jgi:hypothetical protein